MPALPSWAKELAAQYESGASSQFIVHGNIGDRLLLPLTGGDRLGDLTDFLVQVLMPRFDVVLGYDPGSGLRVEKGGEVFSQWPRFKEGGDFPKQPRPAIETIGHYLRYIVNLSNLEVGPGMSRRRPPQVGVIIHGADIIASAQSGPAFETASLACQIRDWGADAAFAEHAIATVLVCENLNDLHPLISANPRATRIQVPLPDGDELRAALGLLAPRFPKALGNLAKDLGNVAGALTGTTLSALEQLLKLREHAGHALTPADLAGLKKTLVERDCGGLIEFIAAKRTLDDYNGQPALKTWLRQDIALWGTGDLQALPMGYLLCGPVGTGKTYLVECLAGEAGVPVVKLKNFRDKWVGSTEGNLEKIFRLVHALGRAIVFIDEADQALGKRDSDANDGGLSGRVYAMMAQEMSDPNNRGRILWILASSRPDLIEVDLKRPGRIDVKIPIFPTTTAADGFALLRSLSKRRGLILDDAAFVALEAKIPDLLTPGAAEALAVKAYRVHRTENLDAVTALAACLVGYQPAVRPEIMRFQIGLAVQEASDLAFVPERLRGVIG